MPLTSTGGDKFEAELPAERDGTYAVGVNITAGGETVLAANTLASNSYPAEYAPGASDGDLLLRASTATGGRGEIEALQAWDTGGLHAGSRVWELTLPFLLLAAFLWPIAVALSRLSLRGATVQGAREGLAATRRRMRAALPRLGTTDPDNAPAPRPATARRAQQPDAPPPAAAPGRTAPPAAARAKGQQTAAVNELLARKRARQGGQAETPPDDDA